MATVGIEVNKELANVTFWVCFIGTGLWARNILHVNFFVGLLAGLVAYGVAYNSKPWGAILITISCILFLIGCNTTPSSSLH